jgi:tetratricopeptide (TPR) repeat protein
LDGTPELDNDLGLFNKAGDLYQKLGNVSSAVDVWERAANRYAESGFPNNAIALCNKILRASPGRTPVYLKLAKLMTERGFVAEAKRNLLEYAQRMQNAGKMEDAFRALKEFADLSPHNEEIRLLLAEQLKQAARTDEARDQLNKLYSEVGGKGARSRATLDRMKAIDPSFDERAVPAAQRSGRGPRSDDLIFIDLDTPTGTEEPEVEKEGAAPMLEIETTSLADDGDEVAIAAAPALEIESTSLADDAEPFEVETTSLIEDDAAAADVPMLEIETTSLAEDDVVGVAEHDESSPVNGLPIARGSSEYLSSELLDLDAEPIDEEPAAAELEMIELEAEVPAADGPAPDVELASLDLDIDLELDMPEVAAPPGAEEKPEPAAGVPDLDLEGFSLEEEVEEEIGEAVVADVPDLEFSIETPSEPSVEAEAEGGLALEPAALGVADLEDMVASDPEDPRLHRQLAEALMEAGDRERGLEELDITLGMYEASEEWSNAEDVVDEALRLEPNSVRHHQKRVEFAFRRNDKSRLVDAYLGLADAFFRIGNTDRARAVYRRVLEHDPDNESAKTALETLEPAVPESAAPSAAPPAAVAAAEGDEGQYIDLGAFLLDDEPQLKDTRMRIEEEEPSGDEARDFDEMLSAFKKGIEANVAEEDWQAHYDLGVAFKEMGLLDEAIAEFQKALRASEGRLRAAEALGSAFYEKGQFSVAATVLRRGIDGEAGSDESKIGLLYWLARCEEEQGRVAEALDVYQRVFAVDIKFQDVGERVKQLSQSGS